MIKILDCYSGNSHDFAEALNGTFSGIIFKAGQGDWLDVPSIKPDWWKIAGDKGLLRGWYWVCDSRYHSSKHIEAIKRWRDAKKLDLNAELGLWSDVEYPYYSMTTEQYWKTPYAGHKNVVDFHYLLETNGVNAGLYSASGVYDEIMKGASSADHDYLAKFRMWPANYPFIYIPRISKPKMFGHWNTWTIWQYHGNPDYSIFNGTDAEFYELFSGGAVPPVDPPPGETNMKGTVITASLNVRNAPVSGAIIDGLFLNDLVEADRKENGWWHLTMIRGVATAGWSYEGASQGYIRTDSDVPPTGLPVLHLTAGADGYETKAFDLNPL